MRIDYHRTLVSDSVRNAAFYEALKAAITPGVTTVADIGAGTGLLGLMASKLGAKRVYLYETAEVAGVAARIIKANKVRNCELIACHSTDMLDPPKVDVVVSETLGNYAFEEYMIDTLADARARFLNPGGVMIPAGVTQWACPVVGDRIHRELTAWDNVGYGLDLSIGRAMSLNNAYVRALAPAELLEAGAAAKSWDTVILGREIKANRRGEVQWQVANPTMIYGVATWWDAMLSPPSITLSTSPLAPRTHWEQLYFPLLEPVALKAGQSLALSLRSRSSQEGGTHLAWTVAHLDATGKSIGKQAMDLDKGYLP
jgi:SAM-dependent methyltransferase